MPTRPRLPGLLCAYTATPTRFAVCVHGHIYQVAVCLHSLIYQVAVPTWPHLPGVMCAYTVTLTIFMLLAFTNSDVQTYHPGMPYEQVANMITTSETECTDL